MKDILNGKDIRLGTCYYPEQWDKALWASDLDRMLKAGITVIRIAEFAWNKTEPSEGKFDYSFFDEFLDLCDEKGMKVIFGTPTATPPAWLTKKYPEVLNCDINGNLYRHGSRRHYNYNSKIYREKSRIITEKLAEHYAKRKCIIGWQLDNEINCETNVFYSESDTLAFREWLMHKYADLDALNAAWGTDFWNQTYTDFDEICVPRPTVNTAQNPHQMLDYYRFISDSARSFLKEQSDILRKYIKPDDFITTNGLFGHLDNHAMTKESLDFYTYDSYPNFPNRVGEKHSEEEFKDRWWSKNLSEARSVSHIFGIMEQQTGANGWNIWPGVSNPRPGQITLWTMQSIAHGADYVSYFRWHTAAFGTEMYWHGILDYSGRDNERLKEVAEIGALTGKLKEIAGKEYKAKVGILRDYDNNFDSEIDKWHAAFEEASENALFTALQKSHTPFDYVYFYDGGESYDLNKYKVLFYPHPLITDKERVGKLSEYVKNGGILILGARSGQKDLNGKCVTDILPGEFKDLSGADVKEYSFIVPDTDGVDVLTDGDTLKAELFVDRLSEDSKANAIGRYGSDYCEGDIAMTVHEYGKGKVYYYGSVFNEDSVNYFTKLTGVKNPYKDFVKADERIELAKRGDVFFLLNYMSDERTVTFKKEAVNILTGEKLKGKMSLPKYGYLLVKRNKE